MKGYENATPLRIFHNGKVLNIKCHFAKTYFQRLFGLIVVPELKFDEALLFCGSCQQMHSFFMGYSLDLVFLNNEHIIIAKQKLAPWRLSKVHFKAKSVVEFSEGYLEAKNILVGDKIEVRE